MREKIVNVLNKIYGVLIAVSLFASILSLIPFAIALIIGGNTAELICKFIYNDYYPYVIVCASAAVIIGLITMYINKHDFSVGGKKKKEEIKPTVQEGTSNENN